MIDNMRTKVVSARITEEEKNKIEEMAKKMDLTISRYVRLVLLREIEKETTK